MAGGIFIWVGVVCLFALARETSGTEQAIYITAEWLLAALGLIRAAIIRGARG